MRDKPQPGQPDQVRLSMRQLLDAVDRAVLAARELESARDVLLRAVKPRPVRLACLGEGEGEAEVRT